jgi:glc operon protein GlcG
MLGKSVALAIMVAILGAFAFGAMAQPLPLPYGTPISLENAKKAAAAAVAEIKKNNWFMAVAITDIAGDLVYFERVDGTQVASIKIALIKSRCAVIFKRPSKVFQDMLASGSTFVLGLEGAIPSEGGIPLVMDGKIVGAIGVSGGTPQQDGQAAKAGADLIK